MKFDIYNFSVLTSSIHESLSSMMGETAVMITEMIIVGIIIEANILNYNFCKSSMVLISTLIIS